jgi:Protein of unknown function (DUF4238)
MRNHYVPQFLQRPWTSPHDGKLEVYHVAVPKIYSTRTVTKSTGYKDDMLALTRDTLGTRTKHDIEEVVLKQVDNDAAVVREKLANRGLPSLTHDERCAWVRFIMSLRIRNPGVVSDLILKSDSQLRQSLAENPFEYLQIASNDKPTSLEEWTEQKYPGLIENFGLSFFHELLNDKEIGTALLRLKWWVFDVSPTPIKLLLGDRPRVFYGGINDPNLAVALPLSPNRLFLATRGATLSNGLSRVPLRTLVAQVNDATVRQSEKYIYARDNSSLRFIQNRRTGV